MKWEKNKWICGKCHSCCQRDDCPGGGSGISCDNYLAPEPTKLEWPVIYRKAYRSTFDSQDVTAKVYRIGHAKAIRAAMMQIHGFTEEEIRDIEREIENDMHPVPGRRDILP